MAAHRSTIADYFPNWIINGLWPCGHQARIDLGRFMHWGMADVPMLPVCKRLRCPVCSEKGPAEIAAGWSGVDLAQIAKEIAAEQAVKVRVLKPRRRK